VTHWRGSEGETGEWSGVASTLHITSEHGVSKITTADALTSAASSRRTDAPADLNGLVRFAERRNLVSARVPSHFNWPLPPELKSRCAPGTGRLGEGKNILLLPGIKPRYLFYVTHTVPVPAIKIFSNQMHFGTQYT